MLVSIVTPSLNQARFIEDAIVSVRSQNHPAIEHIIIDGGSTDGTQDTLKKYDHLIWISEKDRGQSDALNKGFQMAKGDVIGWLNADDFYEPGAVKTIVDAMNRQPDVAMVYGHVHIIDEKGGLIRTRYSPDFDLGLFIRTSRCYIQPVTFFRRAILKDIGFIDIDFHEAMDYEFFIRIGQRYGIRRMPCVLGRFRTHANSKTFSGTTSERGQKELEEIQRRYGTLGKAATPGVLLSVRDKTIMQYYRWYGAVRSIPLLMKYAFSKL